MPSSISRAWWSSGPETRDAWLALPSTAFEQVETNDRRVPQGAGIST